MSEQPYMDRCLVLEARLVVAIDLIKRFMDVPVDHLTSAQTREVDALYKEADAFIAAATPDPLADSPP